jgi:hypothetical protein
MGSTPRTSCAGTQWALPTHASAPGLLQLTSPHIGARTAWAHPMPTSAPRQKWAHPAAVVLVCLQPKFAGRKAGYYFGKGKAGVGYHRDAKQVRGCMGVLTVPLRSTVDRCGAAWEYSNYPSGVPTVDRPRLAGKEVADDAAPPRRFSGQPNQRLQMAYPKLPSDFS